MFWGRINSFFVDTNSFPPAISTLFHSLTLKLRVMHSPCPAGLWCFIWLKIVLVVQVYSCCLFFGMCNNNNNNKNNNNNNNKCDHERSWEDFKIWRPYNRNSVHVECESECDTGNNRGDWTISQSLGQYLSNVPGKHEIMKPQQTAVLSTAHCCGKC
jgi:hypothetical protein